MKQRTRLSFVGVYSFNPALRRPLGIPAKHPVHGGPGRIDDALDETAELFPACVLDPAEPKRSRGASTILHRRSNDSLPPMLT